MFFVLVLFSQSSAAQKNILLNLQSDKQSPGLGNRFIEMVEKKPELIAKYPERYPKRKGNFRESAVNFFAYIIVYSFYETEEIVAVHSIFHTSQHPVEKYRK